MEKYTFSEWSIDRKVRALGLMDEYLKGHIPRSIYETQWIDRDGVNPAISPEKASEIAQDERRFINALFMFYVCLTTDLSWVHI